MKTRIALSLALSLLAANIAFAQDGSDHIHAAAARVAENGSSQTVDRLHSQLGVAENGSSQTVDRLHSQLGVAENGSSQTIDKLHGEMNVAEAGGDIVFNAHLKA